MKNVYIFFFQTQFKTGKTIRFLTRNEYNHVGISFEPDTRLIYSYARYRYYEPLSAGFGIEATDRYYGCDKMTNIKVYEYAVEDDHYDRIREAIDYYLENKASTRYNYFDIITYPFKKHVRLDPTTHTCLSFLLELLERSDVKTIGQLERSLPSDSIIYEGRLDVFEQGSPSKSDIDFFEKRSRRVVLCASVLAMSALCASVVKKLIFFLEELV